MTAVTGEYVTVGGVESKVFETLRAAIERRQVISATYNDRRREFVPLKLGFKGDEEVAKVYQVGGTSSRSLPNWSIVKVSRLEDVELLRAVPWELPRDYDAGKERGFDRIVVRA